MSRKLYLLMFCISCALMLVFFGCSDDSDTPTSPGGGGDGDTTTLSLVDVTGVIRNVTPPVFEQSPAKAPLAESLEVWTQGDYPLLDKIFGDEDPQTLERNLERFEMFMEIAEFVLRVDENGDLITDTIYDTIQDTIDGQPMEMYVSATITELTSPVAIPAAQQDLFGTSIDLDYLVVISVEHQAEGEMAFAITFDSTQQKLLAFEKDMGGVGPGETESQLVYTTLDPRDSTFEFIGTMYNDDNEGEFTVSYIITSESGGGFDYRMSWFSDDVGGENPTILGCIIGGGNKDTEFALKYRQFMPADTAEMDTTWSFDQVFGSDYTQGTGLIADYSEYLNESLILTYDKVPHTDVVNPWATE